MYARLGRVPAGHPRSASTRGRVFLGRVVLLVMEHGKQRRVMRRGPRLKRVLSKNGSMPMVYRRDWGELGRESWVLIFAI